MQEDVLVLVDVVWIVERPGDLHAGRLDHVSFALGLRRTQVHKNAQVLVNDEDSLIPEKANLKLKNLKLKADEPYRPLGEF